MVRTRADGSVWQKPAAEGAEWVQLQDGKGPGPGPGGAADEVLEAGPPGAAWSQVAKDNQLDGHVPEEVIHPLHVDHDLDGDTDTKPVLSWVDSVGAPRHSYTQRFHYNRAALAHPAIAAARPLILAAHAGLEAELTGPHAAAAALGLAHLRTGHDLEDLALADVYHNREQDLDVAMSEKRLAVFRSHTADATHPDKVHYAVRHRRGHTILAPTHHAGLADHHAAGGGHSTPDDARALLESHGVTPGVSRHVRSHALYHQAADLLSKMPPVALNRQGLVQLHANVTAVSDHIAEQYGHHPAPEGMVYVPPALVAAYVEESGGARLWPKAFAALQGPAPEPKGLIPVQESAGAVMDPGLEPPPEPNRKEHPFVGVLRFQGLTIDVENARGSYREGKGWRSFMHAHYGELREVEGVDGHVLGADGDRLDVYVGPDLQADLVVVVQQVKPDTGAYDEDKVMLGFGSVAEAVSTYRLQYDQPGFFGGCMSMSMSAFKDTLKEKRPRGKSLAFYLEPPPMSVDDSTLQPTGRLEPPERTYGVKRSKKVPTTEAEAKVLARYKDTDAPTWDAVVQEHTVDGAVAWGDVVRIFRSHKYGRKKWNSTNEATASSPGASATSSDSPTDPPTSTPTTAVRRSRTPTPSPPPSSASCELPSGVVARLRPRAGGPSVDVVREDLPELVGDFNVFRSLVGQGSVLLTPAGPVEVTSTQDDAARVLGRLVPIDWLRRKVARSYGLNPAGTTVEHVMKSIAPDHKETVKAERTKERARTLYMKCMRGHRKGNVPSDRMIAITDKLVHRDYDGVIDMALGTLAEFNVRQSAGGKPPGAPGGAGESPKPTASGKRRVYQPGEVSTYSDGSRHIKGQDGKWRDEPGQGKGGERGKNQVKDKPSTTLEGARSRLKKLREQRKRAGSPDVKAMLDKQIHAVKERIKHLTAGTTKSPGGSPQQTAGGRTDVKRSFASQMEAIAARVTDRTVPLDQVFQDLDNFVVRVARSATQSFDTYCATAPGYERGVAYLGSDSCPVNLRQAAAAFMRTHGHAAFARALAGH